MRAFVAFLAAGVVPAAVHDAACEEEPWCPINLARRADGKEHANCGHWKDSCPCTCAMTKVEIEKKEVEAKVEAERKDRELDRQAAKEWGDGEEARCARPEGKSASKGTAKLTFLVRAQGSRHEMLLFEGLRHRLTEEGVRPEDIRNSYDASSDLSHCGLWTYKPWIHSLAQESSNDAHDCSQRWFVFLEASTTVSARRLRRVLLEYNAHRPWFLGHGLEDEEASILHSANTPYPHVLAGFALSGQAMQRLRRLWTKQPLGTGQQIEPVYELAHQMSQALRIRLTSLPDAFCVEHTETCATAVGNLDKKTSVRENYGLRPEQVVIAVKTVERFHKSRLPVLRDTWVTGSAAKVLALSNAAFDMNGLKVVDLSKEFGSAVDPEVESKKDGSGHCSKFQAMLQYLHKHEISGHRWFVIVDDDTLINTPQLIKVLNSYNDAEPTLVGERYGWAHQESLSGTNYATTGAGIGLSARALSDLATCKDCACPSPDAPDDMTLGSWVRNLKIAFYHEEGFHQNQPKHYHPSLLEHGDRPISFHRHGLEIHPSEEAAVKAHTSEWKQWMEKYFSRSSRSSSRHESTEL
eukprot:TRINITY_DN12232_c0_g1_i2.p1 TRINITY_DN12232_c0_g1~~TRINITY_DN12232_c0_g1_i2.p1  ORF type:complete len:580 (+),score=103.01 TRINITY_DN12232_c0_g1_i2:63-1802(+)